MKSLNFCIIIIITTVMFVSCSSSDKSNVDKTPPMKPILLPHLGDVGDSLLVDGRLIDDTNNGLSPLPEGDWLRLQWLRLLDNDLTVVRIFRYPESLNPKPVKIDSIKWNNEEYIDRLINTGAYSAIETNWHYFIEAVDHAGNTTVSDTVSYTLLRKPLLVSPANNDEFNNSSELSFTWVKNNTDVSRLRLLLFDINRNCLWSFDESNVTEELSFTVNYNGNPLPSGTYYWRVDAVGNLNEYLEYNSGSKSLERKFIIR